MLKLIVRKCYGSIFKTDDAELFYEIYKWIWGIEDIVSDRRLFLKMYLFTIGVEFAICYRNVLYGVPFWVLSLIVHYREQEEFKKQIKYNILGMRTPFQIRTLHITNLIRKFVSIHGKALGPREWRRIKRYDEYLYEELLSNECNHCCYHYSLEIAMIIEDSTLIWGAIKDPTIEETKYSAHAVILRNGYIYDSNLRQSIKYEDFIKMFKFKTYKEWNYSQYSKYSQESFRDKVREGFRSWCKQNTVGCYDRF